MLTSRPVLIALLGPTRRAIPWRPLLAGAVFGLAIVAVPTAFSVVLQPADLATLLRIAAVAGTFGVAFVLDDPAARLVAVLPVRPAIRHGLRLGMVVPVAAAWWVALSGLTWLANPPARAALPLGGLSVEAAALLAVTTAAATVGTRTVTEERGSSLAVAVSVTFVAAASVLPESAALFVVPQDPHWTGAHYRWVLLLAASAAIGTAAAVRDPARR